MSRALAVVLVGGLAGILVLVGVLGSRAAPRLAGTNNVRPDAFVLDLEAGQRVCQDPEPVPAGAVGLRVVSGTYGQVGPPLAVRITSDGRVVSTETRRVRAGDGPLTIPVAPLRRFAGDAQVCLRNLGARRVALAGRGSAGPGAAVDERPRRARLMFEYLRPGAETSWALLPTVAHRFGLAKASVVGAWTLWALLGLVAAAWGLAALALSRSARA